MSCNNMLEDRNNGGRSVETGNMNDDKVTTENYSWGISTEPDGLGDGEDLLGGFSWPPRSYTCTFCKREFRSAQALGGHMNVHRRDRARLRQLPSSRDLSLDPHSYPSNYSLLSLNLDQNPNPNRNYRPNPNPNISPYFSSTPTMFPSFTSTSKLPPLISSSPTSTQPNFQCQLRYSTTHPSNHLHRGSPNLTNIKSQIPLHKFHGFPNEKEGMIIKNSEIVRLNLEIGLIGESNSDDLDLELRLGCS